MKKTITRILLLVVALVLAMGIAAHAEETTPTFSEAWLMYFASNHETDPANFPWWPQHQRIDQPATETGVEYTNAIVTGPGKYTVGLKFNWQKAEGAIQMNLILDNAEVVFPGYYVDITDIRVNGASIEVKENMYGVYHDDPDSGMVSIYNSYWDPTFEPESTGPSNHRAFDGTVEDAAYLIINPDDIVNGSTIEVDFIVAAEAGQAPEELGEKPNPGIAYASYTGPSSIARLYYQASGWWPEINGVLGTSTKPVITGDGNYTVSAQFVDQGGWTPSGNGAEKFLLIVDDYQGANSAMDGKFIGISDIRINGQSIDFGTVGFGGTGYDNGSVFDSGDGYAILWDQWMHDNQPELPWGHQTWDGSEGTIDAVDPSQLNNVNKIDVDFFVTSEQGKKPTGANYSWSGENTVGVIGLSMRDLEIADDWHSIVPIDLTKTAWYKIPLSISNAYIIGNAYVAVNNGNVNVYVQYIHSNVLQMSESFKWFTNLEDVTPEAITSAENSYTSADVLSVANDLGGADVAYLAINSKATYRTPLDNTGIYAPRYWPYLAEWREYREGLKAMIPTAEEAVVEEASAAE